jgi:hypothetical protein
MERYDRKSEIVLMKTSIFWDITPSSPSKLTHISEEHVSFILRVDE